VDRSKHAQDNLGMPLIRIHEAKSHHHAIILQGLLKSAGYDAHVEGSELMDEFANAARLSGGLSGLLVPEEQAKEAQAFLQDWQAEREDEAAAARADAERTEPND
tara:strand:- start:3943 stop:4257 length:315 start_codon:yes stop_codon:yes gene_type:complete